MRRHLLGLRASPNRRAHRRVYRQAELPPRPALRRSRREGHVRGGGGVTSDLPGAAGTSVGSGDGFCLAEASPAGPATAIAGVPRPLPGS